MGMLCDITSRSSGKDIFFPSRWFALDSRSFQRELYSRNNLIRVVARAPIHVVLHHLQRHNYLPLEKGLS